MDRARREAIIKRASGKSFLEPGLGKKLGAAIPRLALQRGFKRFGHRATVIVMNEKHFAFLTILRQPDAQWFALAIKPNVAYAHVQQLGRRGVRRLAKKLTHVPRNDRPG